MATWNITAPAGSGVGEGGTAASAITEPGDFDGATITDVSVSGTPSLSSDGTTDDTIGVRWRVQTDGGTAIWGDYGSDAASLCSAVLGDSVSSDTIADGSSPSPNPGTAVGADWDEIAYSVNYSANMKDDGETCSWSAFTIVVTYTPSAGEDDLLADDVESASEVTTPAVGQEHALLADDAESASEVSSPVLGLVARSGRASPPFQTFKVKSRRVQTAPPVVPVVSSEDVLLADDVQSTSEVTTPAVGQEHALTATSAQSTSEVTTPAVGQEHALLADDAESASEVTAPAVGQEHALLADDTQSTSGVSSPVLGQEHALLADDVESASSVTTPAASESNILLADSVSSTSEVTTPALAEVHVLFADDVESASSVTTPTIVSDNGRSSRWGDEFRRSERRDAQGALIDPLDKIRKQDDEIILDVIKRIVNG